VPFAGWHNIAMTLKMLDLVNSWMVGHSEVKTPVSQILNLRFARYTTG
jgi:hypothetical protein